MGIKFKTKMASVMHRPVRSLSPMFWILKALSMGYQTAVGFRNRRFDNGRTPIYKLPCGVVSVGNLSAGGTGKTPMTQFLAKQLQDRGLSSVILSRGYKGSLEKQGGLVSDHQQVLLTSSEAGDEPFMMANGLPGTPVLVGGNRFAMGLRAWEQFHPDVLLLDDGFQHRRLHRDVDIVLMDAAKPFGNGHLLPCGILREPPAALNRAHLLILTRALGPNPAGFDLVRSRGYKQPLFVTGHHILASTLIIAGQNLNVADNRRVGLNWEAYFGKRAFLFSGIARPHHLEESLVSKGITVAGSCRFADHHRFSPPDLAKIQSDARQSGAHLLITTQKDFVRLQKQSPLAYDLLVVDVAIEFHGGAQEFVDRICKNLKKLK